jgi:hypothetical protein
LRDRVPRFQNEINRMFNLFWLRHAICNMAGKSSRGSLPEFAKGRYWMRSPLLDVPNSTSEDQQPLGRQAPPSRGLKAARTARRGGHCPRRRILQEQLAVAPVHRRNRQLPKVNDKMIAFLSDQDLWKVTYYNYHLTC